MTTDSLSQSKELIPTFFQHLLGFVGDAIHTWFCASVQLWVLQFLFDLCFLHWKHPDFQPNTSYLTPTSDPYCKPHIRKLSTKYINRPIPSNSIICGSTNHAISEDSFVHISDVDAIAPWVSQADNSISRQNGTFRMGTSDLFFSTAARIISGWNWWKSQMESPEEIHGDTRIPEKNQHESKLPFNFLIFFGWKSQGCSRWWCISLNLSVLSWGWQERMPAESFHPTEISPIAISSPHHRETP